MSTAIDRSGVKRASRRQRALTLRYLLAGALFTGLSVRADAPIPSQEFWSYFVEFGDDQGGLFDPSDFAAVANIPAKAQQGVENASKASKPEQVSHASRATQEQSQ